MAALTLAFVLIYGAALVGWLQPLPNEQAVMRLEPIIFVVIGYYFGRMPARQHETTLKDEIVRLAQKADAAQHAKEQMQQERESLEEKVKNAKAVLAPVMSAKASFEAVSASGPETPLRTSSAAALSILST